MSPLRDIFRTRLLFAALLCAEGCFMLGYEEKPERAPLSDAGVSNGGGNDTGLPGGGAKDGAVALCEMEEPRCEGATFVHCDDLGMLVREDCEARAPDCMTGYCTNQGCKTRNVPDGTGCTDEMFCTKTDTCIAGKCVGAGDPCPDTACASQSCDEKVAACVVDTMFDGVSCGSDLVCDAGECVSTSTCASADCAPECPGTDSCSLSCAGAANCTNTCDCDGPCTAQKVCTLDCQDTASCTAKCQDVWADCKVDCQNADKCVGDCRGANNQDGGDCLIDCTGSTDCSNTCSGRNSVCTTDCTEASKCTTACIGGAQCKTTCLGATSCTGACTLGANCQYDCRGATACSVSCGFASDCLLLCDAKDFYGRADCKFSSCSGEVTRCGDGLFACGRACPFGSP